ncbi:hypothetical protein [Tenacibaculum piscium]|uniref:Uncharacterized protein n=1 Tax=Tenacibaculum piscium TaxID=1458515 RepID=A0A2H1YKC7_9FLAO|nr:hypothetical protein [Tenacibaculum piscium]MBE7629276.1 hypothetical protein [Tenacibaculum piscium]MBE7670063.1 hypothetical protein [Tenacibaculum piscium]MBE7685513.1 hypothetical protein [Tenacibaculum piscium]MBE7690096.1 hypothetical protein [Tenacibaculum piscium]MCG8183277.1 hypothetical protein [Tenacibaculum piscium]
MIQLVNLPLVSWTNGTIMIAIFALVCVGLVATLLILIGTGSTGKKKE